MSTELAAIELGASPEWARALESTVINWGIQSTEQKSHFLGQLCHETAGFKVFTENLNYSAEALIRTWPHRFTPELAQVIQRNPERIANHVYGGRMGNDSPGDGWLYRGRGAIQLTGKDNYLRASQAIYRDERLVTNPDQVSDPPAGAEVAGWFWSTNGINAIAREVTDDAVRRVTRAINGGTNGLSDRIAKTYLAHRIFKRMTAKEHAV